MAEETVVLQHVRVRQRRDDVDLGLEIEADLLLLLRVEAHHGQHLHRAQFLVDDCLVHLASGAAADEFLDPPPAVRVATVTGRVTEVVSDIVVCYQVVLRGVDRV